MWNATREVIVTFFGVAALTALLTATVYFSPMMLGRDPGWSNSIYTLSLKDGTRIETTSESEFDALSDRHKGRVAQYEVRDVGGAMTSLMSWVALALHCSMIVVSVVGIRRRNEYVWGWTARDAGFAVIVGVALGVLGAGYAEALSRAGLGGGTSEGPMSGPDVLVPLLFVAAITAPLGEELLFRGQVFGVLRRSLNPVPAVWATAFLFALLHAGTTSRGLIAIPMSLAGGVCFGWLRVRCGSVWPCVLAHGSYNATVILVLEKVLS